MRLRVLLIDFKSGCANWCSTLLLVSMTRWVAFRLHVQCQKVATTTVVVRNCHGGSGGANAADRANHGPSEETQHQSTMRMNQIIARVAQQLCVPVLDVHALDKAAGFYFQEGEPSDVHVPPIGALQAAFAALLAIQQLLAKRDEGLCSAR